jgi:flagellar hook-associated protein 1 FlgK
MSLNGVMETGLSGLYAATTQLSTAGQNISNANVDGYHRQSVVLASNDPQSRTGFFIGTGVAVQAVRRVYDAFTDQQLRDAKADSVYFDTLRSLTGQVDAALSSDESSALSSIQTLFSKFSALASTPTSAAARQLVVPMPASWPTASTLLAEPARFDPPRRRGWHQHRRERVELVRQPVG